VICKTGARSMRACEFLATQGIDAVNVAGGTLAWIRSGRDYVSGTS
jgi:rhodanese-related sulfurtransferase